MTSIAISPASSSINELQTKVLTATGYDQFGSALAVQPTFTWSLQSGTGSQTPSGGLNAFTTYAAGQSSTTATLKAQSGSIFNTATVTVVNLAPTVATGAAGAPNSVTGTSTALSVLGADGGGQASLTYSWATTGTPPALVAFSPNGTNAAKNATATFTKAGTYNFQVTITDGGGLSTTSAVQVDVAPTPTSLTVATASYSLSNGQSTSFTALVIDQFEDVIAAPNLAWSLDPGSVGSMLGSTYTAPDSGIGPATIRATSGAATNTASVTLVLSAIAATGGDDTIRLIRNATTGKLDVIANATTYSADMAAMTVLSIAGGGGNNTIILDFTNGNPLPAGMLTVDGTASSSNLLQIVGTPVVFPLTLSNGSFSIASPLSLTDFALADNADVTMEASDVNTLSLTSLLITAGSTLDLSNNCMVLNAADPAAALAALVPYLAAGRNGGDWNGTGLVSSAARAQYIANGFTEYTGLAAAHNDTLPIPYVATFSDAPVASNSVLVKYTYAGDATLDGQLNIYD